MLLIYIYLNSHTIIRQHFLFPQHELSLTPLSSIDFWYTYCGGTKNSILLSDTGQMLSNFFLCETRTKAEHSACIWGWKDFVVSPGDKVLVLQLNPHSWLIFTAVQSLKVRRQHNKNIQNIIWNMTCTKTSLWRFL